MVLEIDEMLQNIKRYKHTCPILSVELTVNYLSMYTYYLLLYIRYIYIPEPFAARGLPVANRKTVFWNVLEHSFVTHIRSWLSDSDTSFWLGNGGRKGVV